MTAFSFNGKWLPKDEFPTDKERKAEVFRLIRSGEKESTIRAAEVHRIGLQELIVLPRAGKGDELQLYWKQRTKDCELIARRTCGIPCEIVIMTDEKGKRHVKIAGRRRFEDVMKGDGFKAKEDFYKFFKDGYYWLYPWEKP